MGKMKKKGGIVFSSSVSLFLSLTLPLFSKQAKSFYNSSPGWQMSSAGEY